MPVRRWQARGVAREFAFVATRSCQNRQRRREQLVERQAATVRVVRVIYAGQRLRISRCI